MERQAPGNHKERVGLGRPFRFYKFVSLLDRDSSSRFACNEVIGVGVVVVVFLLRTKMGRVLLAQKVFDTSSTSAVSM